MPSPDSHEAQSAAERKLRAAEHNRVQHGEYGPGHIDFVPPELLCVLAEEREGSIFHRVLPGEGSGGYGSAPLNPGQFACALATSVEFRRMVSADAEIV